MLAAMINKQTDRKIGGIVKTQDEIQVILQAQVSNIKRCVQIVRSQRKSGGMRSQGVVLTKGL